MTKVRVATAWLDGCSGCHMSLLDIDERLFLLAQRIEIIFGPFVDYKVFPDAVDVTLVEGAVSNEQDEDHICTIRERSHILISFGDCAVTANVPAMRNQFNPENVLHRAYEENASSNGGIPGLEIPHLLRKARPVHEFVPVDLFLPGCPPPPDTIHYVLTELLEGRMPDLIGKTRFGA